MCLVVKMIIYVITKKSIIYCIIIVSANAKEVILLSALVSLWIGLLKNMWMDLMEFGRMIEL